jgi:hypothetical protein
LVDVADLVISRRIPQSSNNAPSVLFSKPSNVFLPRLMHDRAAM